MKRYTLIFLSLLIAVSMVLAACQPAVEEPVVEEPVVEEPEVEEPEPEPEITLEEYVAMADEAAAAAAASAEAAAEAAAQAPVDAATVAELVAGYVPPGEKGTIVDVAVADGRFETLVTAVVEAGLADTLAGEGPFTVFAPTDDAFEGLDLDELLADIPALTDILLYHVVPGAFSAADVAALAGLSLETAFGERVNVTVEDGSVFIDDAEVIIVDVLADNGVIHVIDAVIVPTGEEAVLEREPAELSEFPGVAPAARTGAWPDEVIFLTEPDEATAVSRLEVEDFDVYAWSVSNPDIAERIFAASAVMDYTEFSGSYNELTLNPTGPVWEDGRLNPFAVPAIREAMNHLIDREFLVDELLAFGTPRWTAFNSAAADSALLAAEIRAIEVQYAYDKELAGELIGAEMQALGAEMVDGVWNYNGEPVEIILLIRIEDERLDIGDYVANQLEDIGFATFRDYKSAADASPIWISGNPADGLFHIYTGGWITTAVPRNLVDNFAYFYTDMGLPFPLWQAYDPDPEFYEIAEILDASRFSTLEERRELAARALELSMQDSVRVWLYDQGSVSPFLNDISVSNDLYGGISGSWIWAQAIHRTDEDGTPIEGGSISIAMPQLLVEPWNPLGGSNWIFDAMPYRGTNDSALKFDPFTGLLWPQRIESAEVVMTTGTPINHSLDWVTLGFEDRISVPSTAFADWDAVEQRFLTVEEVYLQTLDTLADDAEADVAAAEAAAADAAAAAEAAAAAAADAAAATDVADAEAAYEAAVEAADEAAAAEGAATGAAGRIAGYISDFEEAALALSVVGISTIRQSTVVYPADLYTSVRWHDGSPFSFGDVLMGMILTFDRAKPESENFDRAYVPTFNSFMSTFKAFEIVSTDPLVITTYNDSWQPDVENTVTTWWPEYDFGQTPWHTMTLGLLAEREGLAAFTEDKADSIEAEWLDFSKGETVDFMDDMRLAWQEAGGSLYEATFSEFVTEEEIELRLENLAAWYEEYGHYWIGTGPFFVEGVFPIEGSIAMSRFEDYPDNAAKWLGFTEARIPEVDVEGEGRITIGDEAVFDVTVTFAGEPYPVDDIDSVQYILLDATNTVVFVGEAEWVSPGLWQVTLDTSDLVPGANSLEVVAVSNLVAVPSAGSFSFVTVD